jgi:endonuclease YncB( thermonuclease family)
MCKYYETLLKTDKKCSEYIISGLYVCKVVDVYDGDTIKVVMFLNLKKTPYLFSVRMYGYNSEEMKISTKDPNRESKKQKALEAKNKLKSLILDKIVILEVLDSKDKYGRLIGNVHSKEKLPTDISEIIKDFKESKNYQNINTYMVENGFGKKYFGGKK